ncbi:MAG: OmpA family protein [Leptothrix sp. (in: b-proteobacteria)]
MDSLNQDESPTVGLAVVFATVLLVLVSSFGLAIMRAPLHLDDQLGSDIVLPGWSDSASDTLVDLKPEGRALVTLYFESDQAMLSTNAELMLTQVVDRLRADSAQRVLLSGYHDVSAEPARDAELVKQRLKMVRAALVSHGVAAEAVLLHKPQATLTAGVAREARRVDVHLVAAP